jgi:hypothetical protein
MAGDGDGDAAALPADGHTGNTTDGSQTGDPNAYGEGPPPFAFDETRIAPVLTLTPNTVTIGFWPAGVPQSFHHYEVWYGPGRTTVEAATPPALRQGPERDLNLGALYMDAAQLVSRTFIIDLVPDTAYFAMVRAIDWQAGEIARSTVRTFKTPSAQSASDTISIFSDAPAPGSWVQPPGFGVTTTHPYAGSASLGIDSTENTVLHYAGLSIPIAPLRTSAFDSAFLELAIDCAGGLVDYVELRLGTTNGDDIWFSWPDYVICGPGYSIVQMPLSAFQNEATGAPADETTLTGNLARFWIYGIWRSGPVYIDEIRIRLNLP